jgi:hypothetical protein
VEFILATTPPNSENDLGCHGLVPWRYHGLAPWSFTLTATLAISKTISDATALWPWRVHVPKLISNERDAPRDKPVASSFVIKDVGVAANVTLHGTSPWHPALYFTG